MKFFIEKIVSGSCRLGVLSEVGKLKDVTIETPFCLLHTRAGSIPNLCIDTLAYVQKIPQVALMPLNLLAEHLEVLEEYKKGIAEFTALKNFLVCTSMQDPSTAVPSGYNTKSYVALWGTTGKREIDTELFMKIQEAFQPDWIQCMGDADTCKTSSKKRSTKAVDKTLNFLDEILEKREKSEMLKKTALFGSVVGGFCSYNRKRSAEETSARNVDGFALEGFQSDGQEFLLFEDKTFVDILNVTLSHLPEDKPRIMNAVWRPDAVVEALKSGIDIFDSSYAYSVSEKGRALVFDYQYNSVGKQAQHIDKLKEPEHKVDPESTNFTIDLNNKRYFEDFTPILEGCQCYTCKMYTRSYIHHLLNTSELQSGVLLMIHNLHHYFSFFDAVRQSLKEDKFQQLEDLIIQQRNRNSES